MFGIHRLFCHGFPQIGCKRLRSRLYVARSRLFKLSSMCPGSLKSPPQRRLRSLRILLMKHLALDGKLISFPIQLLLQNPPGQLKFKSIALPAMWLLLLDPPLGMCFLKELVINNCKKKIRDEMNHSINK